MLSLANNVLKSGPVSSGPVFGVFGNSDTGPYNYTTPYDSMTGSAFEAPANGNFHSVLFYGLADSDRVMRAVIYEDNGGNEPGDVIDLTDTGALANNISNSLDTYEIPLQGAAMVSGVKYWAKVWTNAGTFTFYFKDASPDNVNTLASAAYPNPPDPGSGGSNFPYEMSVQVKYTL